MQITHSIAIDAPPARVWELTLDVESWPDFVPTVTHVEWIDTGPVRVGSRARVKQPAQPAKVWTVTVLEPETRFVWMTKSVGLSMTATHRLIATGSGTTNTLTLDLEGLLAPVFHMLFRRLIRNALVTENEAFQRVSARDRQ